MDAHHNLPVIRNLSMLNCQMCSFPLTNPTFQCFHTDMIVCSDCWPMKKASCDSCSVMEKPNRCKVVEDLLESVQSDCPNKEFGCRELMPFINLRLHVEKLCRFSPCFCPLDKECDYASNSAFDIYQHYVTAHRIAKRNYAFLFGEQKEVVVHELIGVDIIHSKGTSILFYLEKYKTLEGVYVDFSYVAPLGCNLGPFAYRIASKSNLAEYENPDMKRVNAACIEPEKIKKCLFVPNSCIKAGAFNIFVCIWKVEII